MSGIPSNSQALLSSNKHDGPAPGPETTFHASPLVNCADATDVPLPTPLPPPSGDFSSQSLSLVPMPSLDVGNLNSHPLGFQTRESSRSPVQPTPSSEPLLISSVVPHDSPLVADSDSRHILVIDRVVGALASPTPSDQSMNDSSDDETGPSPKVDDDMLQRHYQRDSKTIAIVKRAPSKRGKKPKKGRLSPIY